MSNAPSSRSTRLDALDGVRAVAAFGVLTTHVAFQTGQVGSGPLGAMQGRLDCSVAVFFALSGFLLSRPWLAGRPQPIGRYLARRAARILPAYWLAMGVALAVDSAPPGTAVTHLWLGQVYVGGLLPDFSQTWSLSAEVAFYALLPLAMPAFARRSPRSQLRILAAVGALGLFCTAVVRGVPGVPTNAGFWFLVHLDWFAVGIGLAVLVGTPADAAGARTRALLTRCARRPGTCWATAGVLVMVVTMPFAGPLTLSPVGAAPATVKEACYAAIAVLVLAPFVTDASESDVGERGLRRVLRSPGVRWLGMISYGVFLWHLLVLRAVLAFTGTRLFAGNEVEVYCLTVLGSVAISAVIWHAVEKPIIDAAHRRSALRTSVSG